MANRSLAARIACVSHWLDSRPTLREPWAEDSVEDVEEDSEAVVADSAVIVEAAVDSAEAEEEEIEADSEVAVVVATRTRTTDRETGPASAATPTSDSDRSAIGVEHRSPEEAEEEEDR